MTKICKKSLALLLALAICVSAMVCGVIVSAEEATATPTITLVADKEAPVPGDTVKITAQVADFSAVFGADIEITLPAGLTVTPDESVAIGADDEIYYNAEKNTLTYVGLGSGLEMADGVVVSYNPVGGKAAGDLFAFTFVVPEVEAGTEYTFGFSTTAAENNPATDKAVRYCDADENEIVPNTTGITVVVGSKVVKPVLDESIKISANIAVKSTITITYRIDGATSYDNFYLSVAANRISSADGFNYVEKIDTIDKSAMVSAASLYAVQYTGIAMYELNVPLVATLHCLDAEGNEIAYSNPFTTTVTKLATSLFSTTKVDATKRILTDLLNLGTEAQIYFAKDGSDLKSIAYPNDGFDQTYASLNYGTLTNVNSDPSATNVSTAINLALNPGVRYGFKNCTSATDLKVVFTYYDAVNAKDVTKTVTADDLTLAGGVYYYRYQDITFYAGAATVTATVYDGETVLYTHDLAYETVLAANVNSATNGALATAIAKFGKACQAYYL